MASKNSDVVSKPDDGIQRVAKSDSVTLFLKGKLEQVKNNAADPSDNSKDSIISSQGRNQMFIIVHPCDPEILNVKAYCLKAIPDLCGSHITATNDKELIFIIDINDIAGIPRFVQDLYRKLSAYEVTIYTGVNHSKGSVTCLALHISL